MTDPIITKLLSGAIDTLTGGRSENQDYAGWRNCGLGDIVVVCDGMGGMNGGQTASHIAVDAILNAVVSAGTDANPEQVLHDAIVTANSQIIECGNQNPSLKGMGTTVTAILFTNDYAVAAYAGDSRIYQIRKGNKVYRTFDESMVFQQMVKNGILSEEEARTYPQSNIILNALGIFEEPNINIETLSYLSGDRFVLCTDGFWGTYPEPDVISYVTRKGPVADNLRRLLSLMDITGQNNGGGHDNITAAVVDLKRDSKKQPKMSLKNKLIYAILCVLLIFSFALNVSLVRKCSTLKEASVQTEQVDANSKDKDGSTRNATRKKAKDEKNKDNVEMQGSASDSGDTDISGDNSNVA